MNQHNINQYEKAEAIVKSIADFHQAVLNLAPIDTQEKLVSLVIMTEYFKADLFMILATPMPKYPPGGPAAEVTDDRMDELKKLLSIEVGKRKTWQDRFEEMQQKKKPGTI